MSTYNRGLIANRELVEERLDSIMDNFNFERVYNVMKAIDWKWVKKDSSYGVPTVDEIKEKAANLLWNLVNSDVNLISTGGLEVSKDFSDYDDPFIQLKFVVEEWAEGGD